MECKNYELRQRQFYCENCLRHQYAKKSPFTDTATSPNLARNAACATFVFKLTILPLTEMNMSLVHLVHSSLLDFFGQR
jgi:hypothetical protein